LIRPLIRLFQSALKSASLGVRFRRRVPDVNAFDFDFLKIVFALVHRWPALDPVLMYLVNDDFLKGGIIMAIFWWLWFGDIKPDQQKREYLLFAFVSSSAALLLGRFLALCIPYRIRPMQNPLFTSTFSFPYTAPADIPRSWNSVPSDHAILFFCLAASLCMVSRRAGVFAVLYTAFVICLPRIYAGYHYPSDLVAGLLVGTSIALTAKIDRVRKVATSPAFRWLDWHPGSFYAFAFLWTLEVTQLYRTLLNLQGFARHAVKSFIKVHL
jgi:undecaprenyl-diphosphatase